MEDQSKFFNVVIDKTNQKLNSFQAQVIVLESQLQMAIDERDTYKTYVDGLPSLNFNITELDNTKKELEECQGLLKNSLEELNTYKQLLKSLEDDSSHKLRLLEDESNTRLKALEDDSNNKLRLLEDESNNKLRLLEDESNNKLRLLEDESNTRIKVLEDKNAELELRINSGSSYLKDQNETLLQEIKRLKSEISNLSSNR